MNPKNQNFQKNRRYYHFIKINDSHMMYGSSDTECNGQNVLSFWTIFCPFNSLTTQKIKILKKWKKHLKISPFYITAQKIMITWCTVPKIWCETDVIVISYFGLFFAFLPPSSPKNQNFEKMKKKPWRYHHFTYVY